MTNYGSILSAALIGLLMAALVAVYVFFPVPHMPVGVTTEASPASEVAKEVAVPLSVEFVKVFRPEVKVKLKLPKAVIENPNTHVVASSKVAGDERPHTITTTLNATTGEFTTYDRADPLPWLSVNTKTEVGMYVGLKNGEQAARLEARQELLQVKAVRLGAVASVDSTRSETDAFVGIGAWVRW